MSAVHTSNLDESIYAVPDDAIHNGEMWAAFSDPEPWNPCILTLGESQLILQSIVCLGGCQGAEAWASKYCGAGSPVEETCNI